MASYTKLKGFLFWSFILVFITINQFGPNSPKNTEHHPWAWYDLGVQKHLPSAPLFHGFLSAHTAQQSKSKRLTEKRVISPTTLKPQRYPPETALAGSEPVCYPSHVPVGSTHLCIHHPTTTTPVNLSKFANLKKKHLSSEMTMYPPAIPLFCAL